MVTLAWTLLVAVCVAQEAADRESVLIEALRSNSAEARDDAARRLRARGAGALDALTAALKDPDANVRRRVQGIIDEIRRAVRELPAPVARKLDRVEGEVAYLRSVGRREAADALAARLRAVRRDIETGAWPAGETPEVHVVSVDRPRKDDDQVVVVRVTLEGVPLILVLTGYEQLFWRVEAAKGVVLKRVIVGGFHHQGVDGVPKDVPLEKHVHEDGSKTYFHAWERNGEDWCMLDWRVRQLAGAPPWTHLGCRQTARPIVVGPGNEGWVAERRAAYATRFCDAELAPALQRLADELRRQPYWIAPYTRAFEARSEIAQFTVSGEVKDTRFQVATPFIEATINGEPRRFRKPLSHLASDGAGRVWAAMCEDSGTPLTIVAIDPKTRAFTELPKDGATPALRRVRGLTFDRKRRRLLLAGDSALYAIEPDTRTWSVVTAVADGDFIEAIAHAEDEDVTYVVTLWERGQWTHAIRSIQRWDPQGLALDPLPLMEPIPMRVKGYGFPAVCLAEKRLALVLPPQVPAEDLRTRTIVIDRTTGETEFER